jgi:pantoate kinase
MSGITMREATTFAPGHLTGFFQICDQPEDPLMKGARGSGVSLTRGIYTRVSVEPSQVDSQSISINGDVTGNAFVSQNVLERFRALLSQPHSIRVEHTLEVPMTAGFGSSGAGALTLAISLNEALRLGLSRIDAAQIAHGAEIECRTGLGSVFAALAGGFGALIKAGGPGVGEAIKYDRSDELAVVYLHFGPIATKDALSDPFIRRRINELGGRYVDQIKDDLRPDLFMELSRRFTEHVGLATHKIRKVFDATDREGYQCTMAMFGETVFALIEDEDAPGLVKVLKRAAPGFKVEVTGIDTVGARLL